MEKDNCFFIEDKSMLLKILDALSERKVIVLQGSDLKMVIFWGGLGFSLISTCRRNKICQKRKID